MLGTTGGVTRRVRLLALLGMVLGVDVALWLGLGANALARGVPDMVSRDLDSYGGHVPYGLPIREIVLLRAEHAPADLHTLSELRAAFARHGLSLLDAAEPAVATRMSQGRCEGCLACSYSVALSTPLFAEVYTDQFLFSGGSSRFRHRRLWFFGWWLRLSDELVGME
jgi:hypothetical protein